MKARPLDRVAFLEALEIFIKHPGNEEWLRLHEQWFCELYCLISNDPSINGGTGEYYCDDRAEWEDDGPLNPPICPLDKFSQGKGPCSQHLQHVNLADLLQACIEILTDLRCKE